MHRTASPCLSLMLVLGLAATATATATVGCGSKQSQTNTPPNPTGNTAMNQPPPPGYPGYPAATGYPTAAGYPPSTGAYPTATATTPPPPTGAIANTATPLDPTAAGAAGLALTALATADAPGMGKEGAPMAGNFQEGQLLAQPITIQPGKCYTFLAAGVGPQELEIQLLAATPIPGLAPMLGDQKGATGKVVLGPGSSCVKLALLPVPVQANWVIKSTKGGGVVAGQAYSK